MKYSATRIVVGFVGIMAAGAWPIAALAGSSGPQSGDSQSDTGSYGGGQQGGSKETGTGTGTSQDTGSYSGGQQEDVQKPSSDTGAYGGGQQQGVGGTAESAPLDTLGRSFLNETAQVNAGELQIAQLAESKAQNPEVKSFAQSLVQQYQRVSTQLNSLASQHNVKLPSSAGSVEQRDYQELSRLSGDQFDRQFLDTMIRTHRKVISSFERVADSESTNPQVQAWAVQTLPDLRTHLMDARDLRKQIEGQPQSEQGQQAPKGKQPGGMQQGGEMQPQPSGGGY